MIGLVASTMEVKSQLVESHVVFEATDTCSENVYVIGWAKKKPKFIVCNTGTTQEAADCVRYSTRKEAVYGDYVTVSYEKRIKRCQAIEQFFRRFGAID